MTIMTEREKMLAGELYDCGDNELITQWHKAKNLIRKYNNTRSEDEDTINKILKDLLGNMGNNLWITPPFFVDNVVIGEGSVVTKDIPDSKLAYGNPCKVVRTSISKDKL